jgi:hypothetical protein
MGFLEQKCLQRVADIFQYARTGTVICEDRVKTSHPVEMQLAANGGSPEENLTTF